MEAPKSFWKYYDDYRRGLITLNVFSAKAGLSELTILHFLEELALEKERDYISADDII